MARQPRTVTNLTTKTYPSADGSPVHRTSSFWFLPGSPNLLASSPASSGQSMRVGQRSEASFEARQEWKVLMAYGPEGRRREILEGEFRWLIETLYPKLVIVEEAFWEFERVLNSHEEDGDENTALPNDDNDNTEPANNNDSTYSSQNLLMIQPNPTTTTTLHASVRAAAKHADETMRVQGLRVEAIPFPSSSFSSPSSSSQYTWTLYHQTGNNNSNNNNRNSSSSSCCCCCPQELVVGRGVICSKEELYTAEFWTERRKALQV